ncbi:DUF6976 family protein [Telmatospirillum siberiense]|uniref:Uncharacterized protein n=1 Tax=Telmatospirillum siberiense TaxID=382514 RepID=A0A2N3PWY4_9PROT|nr:hypothetical protein [Telmatospirillum siberiense]PKU24906.1 hypothetical protein CWS72_08485 [Telmatospirillum siberiense]
MRAMLSVEEVKALLNTGKRLLLSGDEDLLRQLPRGQWVGGTTPYFIGEKGGVMTRAKIFANVLPPEVVSFETRFYSESQLPGIVADEPCHGFSFVIIPAFTRTHQSFAENVQSYPCIFDRPLVGWIAGVALEEIGKRKAKVVDGQTGRWSDNNAICLHAGLSENIAAEVGIVNPFIQGAGDTITVDRPGFRFREAHVNGVSVNLAEYFLSQGIDHRLPLVANYSGAMVNVSIKSIDQAAKRVAFYAPLFPHIDYRLAVPVEDYQAAFTREFNKICADPTLSMNCILNFIYGDLEGKRIGDFMGPITFGEIAYGLLNQTLVYMVLRKT